MRKAKITRKTRETGIEVSLRIEGKGRYDIKTPVDFFTHMLETFAKHSLCDIALMARGGSRVDQHHLVEDCGISLGAAFSKALGSRKGINRAGYFVFPMDDALAVCAVDIGGRPYLQFDARFKRRFCGGFDTDLVEDFFCGFAQGLSCNVAVRVLAGRSDHHKIEAVFKAFAKSMKMACSKDSGAIKDIPSTKGRIRL